MLQDWGVVRGPPETEVVLEVDGGGLADLLIDGGLDHVVWSTISCFPSCSLLQYPPKDLKPQITNLPIKKVMFTFNECFVILICN